MHTYWLCFVPQHSCRIDSGCRGTVLQGRDIVEVAASIRQDRYAEKSTGPDVMRIETWKLSHQP